MPARVSRLKERFKSAIEARSTARFGSTTAYTQFSAAGVQTAVTTARVQKEIFLPPEVFHAGAGEAAVAQTGGVLTSASLLFNVTGSILTHGSGSLMALKALQACTFCASPRYAFARVPVPLDADTSGSLWPYIDYTYHDTLDTTGSSAAFHVAAAYLRSGTMSKTPCVVRTSVCVEKAASYTATASGEFLIASMPALPSFGSTDRMLLVAVGWSDSSVNASTAENAGSSVALLGLRLRYVANKLGTTSTE
jgi:hypothetical protein